MRRLRLGLPALLAFAALPAAPTIAFGASETWGTSGISYVQIPAAAFRPRLSTVESVADSMGQAVWCATAVGFCEFHAPVTVPSGAQIVYLELDFHDVSATEAVGGYLVVCNSLATSCAGYPDPFLTSGVAFDAGSARVTADVTADGIFVDNRNNHYNLVTYMAGGGNEHLVGWIVGYRLQVSDPPATASFNDVPTGHPFFQFVEALADSGITAGCSAAPPLYCPDAPVTRGQMAVFLAKALGLNFP